MNRLEAIALERTIPKDAKSVLVVSSVATEVFELYFKARLMEIGNPRLLEPTGLGELKIALLNIIDNQLYSDDCIILMDWEDIWPGMSFRSTSLIQETRLQKLTLHIKPLIELITKCAKVFPSHNFYIIPPVMERVSTGFSNRHFQTWDDCLEAELILALNGLTEQFENIKVLQIKTLLAELSSVNWTSSKSLLQTGWPYSAKATDLLAQNIARIISHNVDRKKILITDLDNTLWRGIIGEDGLDNVRFDVDEESIKHLWYQRLLNKLAAQGVLVAVCSKNDPDVAQMGLDRPDLVFKKSNIVAQRMGWRPKSEMIAGLLKSINLLPDSAVFVDDSPFETEEVSASIKTIATLRFPENNADVISFAQRLESLFSTNQLTEEDRQRLKNYNVRKHFESEMVATENRTEYLKGLEMEIRCEPVFGSSPNRPFQLINKTNQFNLNGIRESRESWNLLFQEANHVFQYRLKDRLGDYGIIAIVVLGFNPPNCDLKHFVVSCQVFSRDIEHGILAWVFDQMKRNNCKYLRAFFRPTAKNEYLRKFLALYSEQQFYEEKYDSQKPVYIYLKQNQNHTFIGSLFGSAQTF